MTLPYSQVAQSREKGGCKVSAFKNQALLNFKPDNHGIDIEYTKFLN